MGITKQELMEENIMEYSNEYDDGAMEQWISENESDLSIEFIEEFDALAFQGFCKEKWNEMNE